MFAGPDELVATIFEDASKIERGQIGFSTCCPPLITSHLIADVFWLDACPLKRDDKIEILCGPQYIFAKIEKISTIINIVNFRVNHHDVEYLAKLHIGNIRIKLDTPICIDPFDDIPDMGGFTIVRDNKIAGGGILK